MVAEVFLQGHEFGIGGGGVANHYFSSRLSKNSRAVAAERKSSCQKCLKIRPLDNNDFSYSITNKITIAQIY